MDGATAEQLLAAVREERDVLGRTLAQVERWGNLGVWEVDLVSEAVYWSTQVYEIFGIEEQGIEQFRAIVHPDDLGLIDHVTQRVVRQPGPYRVTHRLMRGREFRTVDQHMQSIPDETGTPVRVLGTVIDVTATHALQEKLHQADAARTIGLLAGGLVHDFKNCLAVISGHTSMLLGGEPTSARDRAHLEAIGRATERAASLTRRLMAVGHVSEGRTKHVAAREVFGEVASLIDAALPAAVSLTVEIDEPDESMRMLADPDRLNQVLVDLVLNARDANARTITLRSRSVTDVEALPPSLSAELTSGAYGLIQVADDGDGMDAATLARVFEPFFTTKASTEGSGLGLATAQTFAIESMGAIDIDTNEAGGVTVSLLLPLVGKPDRARSASRRSRRSRVLIASTDEYRAQRVRSLVDAMDLQTVVGHTIEEVEFVLKSEPIDAVVLDDTTAGAAALVERGYAVPTVLVTAAGSHGCAARRTIGDEGDLADALVELLGHDEDSGAAPGTAG